MSNQEVTLEVNDPTVVVQVVEAVVVIESAGGGGGGGGYSEEEVRISEIEPSGIKLWVDLEGSSEASLDDLSDVDTTGAVDGSVLIYSSTGWVSGSLPAGLQTRTTATITTASLAANATENGNVALAAGYRLLSITTSASARIRLYTTDAKRTADASRPIGTDPTGDHGVVFEFVSTSGLLSADLSPAVDGFDGKTITDGAIPYGITNTGAGAAVITVTLIWIRTE